MFERSFFWTMRNGSRLLFAAAILMLIAGILSLIWTLNESDSFVGQPGWPSLLANLLYSQFSPAAYLLFGAVLTDRLRRDGVAPS